jgi:hypothetical protein
MAVNSMDAGTAGDAGSGTISNPLKVAMDYRPGVRFRRSKVTDACFIAFTGTPVMIPWRASSANPAGTLISMPFANVHYRRAL